MSVRDLTGCSALARDYQIEHHADPLPLLLIADEDLQALDKLSAMLDQDFRILLAGNDRLALKLARHHQPDVMLLARRMPGLDGLAVCRALKGDLATEPIPIIMVTELENNGQITECLAAGAVDYLSKPYNVAVMRARIKHCLGLATIDELRRSRVELVHALSRASGLKDNETGLHALRVGLYSEVLGRAMGMDAESSEELRQAAELHDIGKIGIPDSVLHHTGGLDSAQWAIMRKHPEIGSGIVGQHASRLLIAAYDVALSHHEKWDGSGYPAGLAGSAIPLVARITAIADVFDALTSRRPYKEPISVERALVILQEENGRHFDPQIFALFMQSLPEILSIQRNWRDDNAEAVDGVSAAYVFSPK